MRGERIVCQYRQELSKRLVHGSGRHKAIQIVVKGFPATAEILKPWGKR